MCCQRVVFYHWSVVDTGVRQTRTSYISMVAAIAQDSNPDLDKPGAPVSESVTELMFLVTWNTSRHEWDVVHWSPGVRTWSFMATPRRSTTMRYTRHDLSTLYNQLNIRIHTASGPLGLHDMTCIRWPSRTRGRNSFRKPEFYCVTVSAR